MTKNDTTNPYDPDAFRDFLVQALDKESDVLITGGQRKGVRRLFVTWKGRSYWLVIE